MTTPRAILIVLLALLTAASTLSQPKSKSTTKSESKDPERKPTRYEPLPHEPPQIGFVDINYPPIMIAPPAPAPPRRVHVSDAGPEEETPQAHQRMRKRVILRVELDDCMDSSLTAGYSFASEEVVSCEDSIVDIYLSTTAPDSAYLLVPQDNDIKDLGEFGSLREVVRFRPKDWSDDHAALLAPGHVYVVWTYDGNFYLVRVLELAPRHVTFEWTWHSMLSRSVAADAEKRQRERDAEKEKRKETLGPYFVK